MYQTNDYFAYSAKIALWALAALLPIWFVPFSIGVEFGREVTFGVLIFAGVILWLLSVLTRGEIRFVQSPILWAAGLMAAVFAVSAFYSASPFVSFFLAAPVAERVSALVLGILLMILAGAVLTTDEDVGKALELLFLTSGIAALIVFVQLVGNISLFRYLGSFAQGIDFNAVGSINGFALFAAVVFSVGIGVVVSRSFGEWRWWKKIILVAILALLLADMFLVNFGTAWITLLGAMIFLWGFLVKDMRGKAADMSAYPNVEMSEPNPSGRAGFGWRYALALGLIALTLFIVIAQNPVLLLSIFRPKLRRPWAARGPLPNRF